MIGFPIVGIRCVINDGASHAVDSSEQAFKTAALDGVSRSVREGRSNHPRAHHEGRDRGPQEFQGGVVGQVNQRRGVILETVGGDNVSVTCEVPLNAMFGYSTDLRSATQGKGDFHHGVRPKYATVPKQEQEEMVKKYREKLAAEAARK
jgi:elongation factor G